MAASGTQSKGANAMVRDKKPVIDRRPKRGERQWGEQINVRLGADMERRLVAVSEASGICSLGATIRQMVARQLPVMERELGLPPAVPPVPAAGDEYRLPDAEGWSDFPPAVRPGL